LPVLAREHPVLLGSAIAIIALWFPGVNRAFNAIIHDLVAAEKGDGIGSMAWHGEILLPQWTSIGKSGILCEVTDKRTAPYLEEVGVDR
jgi:hypothetical protein